MRAFWLGIASLTAAMTAAITPEMTLAEPVQISFQGRHLNGNLENPHADARRKPIFLIIHGTWAHHGMEIIKALQQSLSDQGHSSLAPTLSLGVDDRQGFLKCEDVIHARHDGALEEIDAWMQMLTGAGWSEVTLIGHSRGAAQVALYQARSAPPSVVKLGLIAPMVWQADAVRSSYPVGTASFDAMLGLARTGGDELIGPMALLSCDRVQATGATFLSYYGTAVPKHTPQILQEVDIPVQVFIGTDDEVSPWGTADITQVANRSNVAVVEIEGADHFFRDLYLEDVVDVLLETME